MPTKGIGSVLRVLSIVIDLVFAVSIASITILCYILGDSLTNFDTYSTINKKIDFIDRIHGSVAEIIIRDAVSSRNNSIGNQGDNYLAWDSVADAVVPIEWLEAAFSSTVKASIDWLKTENQPYPNIEISLVPIKQSFLGENGPLGVLPLLQNVSDCSSNNKSQVEYFPSNSLVSCWPQKQNLIEPAEIIAKSIGGSIMETISLEAFMNQGIIGNETRANLSKIHAGACLYKSCLQMGFWLSGFFLVFYALLNASSSRQLLRRFSLPFYLTGGLCLLFVLAWHIFMDHEYTSLISPYLPNLHADVQLLVLDLGRALSEILELRWLVSGGVLIGLGVIIDLARVVILRLEKSDSTANHAKELVRIKRQFR